MQNRAKFEQFPQEQNELASLLGALSHPARIEILETLAKRGECICGEIVEILPLAQSTVSQHLKQLLDAGLIKGQVDGPKSCYCINPKAIKRLGILLEKFINRVGDCCADPKVCR